MYQGSYVALATPFNEDYSLDLDAYGRLIEFQIENGTNGIVPCGCTGEAATLSHDEQKQIIRFAIEKVAGRVPVIAGTGSNNTKEAIGLTKYAAEVGADGALLITPYYNKPTAEGQIAHYRAVAEAGIPVMLYNVPGRTGTKMSAETIAELSKTENIVSVKEACGSVEQVVEILMRCDINVLSGDDGLTLPMIAVGAKGVVSVAANVVPKQVSDLCAAANAGDFARAKEIHYAMYPLFQGLFLESNPLPVKATLAKMGLIKNILRLPLTPMRSEPFAQLETILRNTGVIDK